MCKSVQKFKINQQDYEHKWSDLKKTGTEKMRQMIFTPFYTWIHSDQQHVSLSDF